ncbi:MAG: PAS domain-containing protein [Calditrichaeota bacterium]|nr:PAS domain-containing protein [Calditrichota bacterium]
MLRQVFEFHRSMVQNLNSGLLTIDLAGEIIFANKVAARLLGLEVSDLLGKKVVDLFNKSEDGEAFLRECTRRGQRIDEWEAQLFHPQYRQITVGIDAAYMEDTRNSFQGIVLLLRNLTEVMEMRNQVKRMEQLALLGEMAAGLAHEVRNPLAGIKATAQLLEDFLMTNSTR